MKSKRKTFVMMPFGGEFDHIYNNCIKPIVSSLGLFCIRADEHSGPSRIMDEIWQEINSSEILIADVTGKNSNVCYELGLAHALSKPVILITQDASEIPFDIRHLRVLQYKSSPDGLSMLAQMITDSISEVTDKSETHRKSKYVVLHTIQEVSRDPLKLCFLLGEHLVRFGAGDNYSSNRFGSKAHARDCCEKANEYLSLIGVDFRFQNWIVELDLDKKENNGMFLPIEEYGKIMPIALQQLYTLLEEKGRRFAESCHLGIKWEMLSRHTTWQEGAWRNRDLVWSALNDHAGYLNLDIKLRNIINEKFLKYAQDKDKFSDKAAAKYFMTKRAKIIELL